MTGLATNGVRSSTQRMRKPAGSTTSTALMMSPETLSPLTIWFLYWIGFSAPSFKGRTALTRPIFMRRPSVLW